ncbi:asparagine synthase (glutamine-hydrolyzing) [Ammonifex thiophilus]|uniref:asparagine synthase (glutamine-hydrolyzing) n=1 Tax=Ammonifex thiophilus TaxID=444093 RepID=A0A3D8P6X6_9THEO|nr:asparagine synthase (glutamine-hydrolyzing) [Ammonifex thiophilus]RDV84347.1 asparagine synthase (glutamine-hydrolyzing) [Ammonifex thiophilus]
MCGFAGWIDWEEDLTRQREIIERMGAAVSHRGPDEGGIWLSPQAAFAHRRLIVLDPEGGKQPFTQKLDGRIWVIVYNGEIYNLPELRQELRSLGFSFQTRSDVEAVLLAYLAWGTKCVSKLNGIFAFAVWDEKERTLFLARDRLGIKPLFFSRRGSAFLFASEIKALLVHPAVPPEVDELGLAEIFVLGPGRTPGCAVFRHVEELKPGHWLTFSPQGIQVQRYWRLESRPHKENTSRTAAELRSLLEDCVRRQLISEVPLGSLLSGGLDSSAVTFFAATALREKGETLASFAVDYRENTRYFSPDQFQPQYDTPWATEVASLLQTRHRTVVIDPEELGQALLPALKARDLPGMADVDSSLLLLAREVKKEVTVVLSGEGADEIFGGYPWFRRAEDLSSSCFPWIRHSSWRQSFLSPELQKLLHPQEYLAQRYAEALAEVPRLPGEEAHAARLREISYLSIFHFMPVLLERKDRMAMAAGLEARVPFCDHRLVEYVWNIPWEMKFWGGKEKGILRLALKGILPDSVLQRRKSPYPKTHHPAYTRFVKTAVLRLLEDPQSPLLPLVNREKLRELALTGGVGVDTPWFGQLMTGPQLLAYFLQVDLWLRHYRVILV